ncbi:MAG TPA: phosphatidylglycerol lysyltransferase domain-containing protein [Vicinamibacterales bacterium]|jgi:phosphatidylglycerol lysyltransferase|nr:phosphatidylglycerol lysyltransferase domain-containing protein [Vicinamibacterales bacterium]
MKRRRLPARLDDLAVWALGHAVRLWPFVLFAVVVWLSWHTLRQIHTRDFRVALRALHPQWIAIAGLLTILNVAVMGWYDVVAFRHTRARARERWRYGAVAFAWSNFLTLGPLAGPAIRFWLYRPSVDGVSDLSAGIVSITVAFASGLAGWAIAIGVLRSAPLAVIAAAALACAAVIAWTGRAAGARFERFAAVASTPARALAFALVGWLDWLLAGTVFVACLHAGGFTGRAIDALGPFFFGQVLGLASLIPGGFGTADAYWLTHVPLAESTTAAALMAYRFVYYIGPWAIASLLLLRWATRRSTERRDVGRRSIAGLVGGAGVLIMLSAASPALHARLLLLEKIMPLPLVEAGQLAAALAGLLLLVLARGLGRGYRAAFRATRLLLVIAAGASILKGLDWEESLVLVFVAIAASSQSAIFDRPSRGDWLEGSDLAVACGALALFFTFGFVAHNLQPATLSRVARFGYHLQSARFLRTGASLVLAVSAAGLYLFLRPRVEFEPPTEREIQAALDFIGRYGSSTTPLMVANRDKSIFANDHGLCLYRTIGPYLAVFADPVVTCAADRPAFLEALFEFAGDIDRRPLFYQVSLDWIPLLHDRGYHFFKLGEEAVVPMDRVTDQGHAGKETRQTLRRAERDGVAFRILAPFEVEAVLPQLRAISDDWLRTKGVTERQFSIGAFSDDYIASCRCAIVEQRTPPRILAFANLLEGPRREELSVDLMRSRSDGPRVMDFLITSLLLEARRVGYQRFNLGMAPLASVGEQQGAHVREQLGRLIFQRGEHWYNFQGVRFYKQKFNPDWVPRYMAYQSTLEWPVAAASVSALIAGGWGSALRPARDRREDPTPEAVRAHG